MPSEQSATPAAAVSESVSTQALIQQIAAEARSAGQSVLYDPDSPVGDPATGDAPPPKGGKPARPTAADSNDGATESDPSSDNLEDQQASSEEDPGEGQDEQEPAAQAGEISLEAVKAALGAEGGTDVAALAKALGVQAEALGLTPGAAKFLRLEKKKANATLERAHTIAVELEKKFGDQVKARKAASEGDLEPAIAHVEATFGMSWNELNKMVGLLLQGKPIGDLESKRELRELKKRESERQAAETTKAQEAATAAKVTQAKTWIQTQIKGDKLASPELSEQLRAAGFPPVVDLVFEEMQLGYAKGLTDPKKALEKVRAKLEKQAKALRTAGLVPGGKPAAKPAPVTSTGKPRNNAQTGAAGNSRPMTDQELRTAVLKEAGLWRAGP
jgi:hypothetical protein